MLTSASSHRSKYEWCIGGVHSTACTPLAHDEVQLTNRVKVAIDLAGNAIYFSRGMLPHNKAGAPRKYPQPYEGISYLLHLGIVCFDRKFLQQYCTMPATPLMVRIASPLERVGS